MSRNIKVIQATDFIRATPDGKANLEKGELLLKEIAEAGAGLDEVPSARGLRGE